MEALHRCKRGLCKLFSKQTLEPGCAGKETEPLLEKDGWTSSCCESLWDEIRVVEPSRQPWPFSFSPIRNSSRWCCPWEQHFLSSSSSSFQVLQWVNQRNKGGSGTLLVQKVVKHRMIFLLSPSSWDGSQHPELRTPRGGSASAPEQRAKDYFVIVAKFKKTNKKIKKK